MVLFSQRHSVTIIGGSEALNLSLIDCFKKHQFEVNAYDSAEDFILEGKLLPDSMYLVYLAQPNIPGINVIRLIRKALPLAIIVALNNAGSIESDAQAVKNGADFCVPEKAKPDSTLYRILNYQEKLRRLQPSKTIHGIEFINEGLTVRRNGIAVKLTRHEYELMQRLFQEHGQIVSRASLLKAEGKTDTSDRVIDVRIVSLRKKLEKINIAIRTKRGEGYSLVVLPEEQASLGQLKLIP